VSDSDSSIDDAVQGTCSARAALAGNPSDGYGGAVVSIPVSSVRATVDARPCDRFEIDHSPTPDDTFTDLDELCDRVDRFGFGDARQLVVATLRGLRRHLDAHVDPVRLTVRTTIPRSVGLAGSSAIVIATIRALVARHPDATWSRRLRDDPALLAAVALDAEVGELGITAGLQDRVVQAYDAPVLMDFSTLTPVTPLTHPDASATVPAPRTDGVLMRGTYDELPWQTGILFVATAESSAAPSGVTHRSLRDDYDADVGGIRRVMEEIACQARTAATAIRRGDIEALGSAMDTTLDLRQSMMVLDPRHLAMAEIARSHGGHANWSGSGGAITVLAPNEAVAALTRAALVDELGCSIVDV
jgi:glucuronokinase